MNERTLGGQDRPIHVHLVNPPTQDPWRTQGEYGDNQRRAQHLYRVAVVSVVMALLGTTAATATAVAAWRALSSNPVRVECIAPPARPTIGAPSR
jgi:hypothetical protein